MVVVLNRSPSWGNGATECEVTGGVRRGGGSKQGFR